MAEGEGVRRLWQEEEAEIAWLERTLRLLGQQPRRPAHVITLHIDIPERPVDRERRLKHGP